MVCFYQTLCQRLLIRAISPGYFTAKINDQTIRWGKEGWVSLIPRLHCPISLSLSFCQPFLGHDVPPSPPGSGTLVMIVIVVPARSDEGDTVGVEPETGATKTVVGIPGPHSVNMRAATVGFITEGENTPVGFGVLRGNALRESVDATGAWAAPANAVIGIPTSPIM